MQNINLNNHICEGKACLKEKHITACRALSSYDLLIEAFIHMVSSVMMAMSEVSLLISN